MPEYMEFEGFLIKLQYFVQELKGEIQINSNIFVILQSNIDYIINVDNNIATYILAHFIRRTVILQSL
jgi:hypothetical protein